MNWIGWFDYREIERRSEKPTCVFLSAHACLQAVILFKPIYTLSKKCQKSSFEARKYPKKRQNRHLLHQHTTHSPSVFLCCYQTFHTINKTPRIHCTSSKSIGNGCATAAAVRRRWAATTKRLIHYHHACILIYILYTFGNYIC